MRPFAGEPRTERLVAFLESMNRTSLVRYLTSLLAFDANTGINLAS